MPKCSRRLCPMPRPTITICAIPWTSIPMRPQISVGIKETYLAPLPYLMHPLRSPTGQTGLSILVHQLRLGQAALHVGQVPLPRLGQMPIVQPDLRALYQPGPVPHPQTGLVHLCQLGSLPLPQPGQAPHHQPGPMHPSQPGQVRLPQPGQVRHHQPGPRHLSRPGPVPLPQPGQMRHQPDPMRPSQPGQVPKHQHYQVPHPQLGVLPLLEPNQLAAHLVDLVPAHNTSRLPRHHPNWVPLPPCHGQLHLP